MNKKGRKSNLKPGNGWKTFSRGHKYRGLGICPVCWPVSRKTTTSTAGKLRQTEIF